MPPLSALFTSALLAIAMAGLCGCNPRDAADADARLQVQQSLDQSMNPPEDLTKLPDPELRKKLTPEQYAVCKQNATEPAFHNAYWNNHQAGIYVDVISGEPLFASVHKFDSGTGWPSFFQPLQEGSVVEKTDLAYGVIRTEVRAARSDAHLGHVFDDGPQPTGLRYCINSASLRFVPKDKLESEGLGQYLPLFEKSAARKALTGSSRLPPKREENGLWAKLHTASSVPPGGPQRSMAKVEPAPAGENHLSSPPHRPKRSGKTSQPRFPYPEGISSFSPGLDALRVLPWVHHHRAPQLYRS